MYKKLLTALFTSAIYFSQCIAQPAITSEYEPGVGDTFVYKIADTTASFTNTAENTIGAGVTWGLGTLPNPSFNTLEYDWLAPASTPYSADFTGTNLAAKVVSVGMGDAYEYYKNSSDSLNYLGNHIGIATTTYLPNGYSYFKYPMSYGNSFTDTIIGYNPGNGSNINGKVTVTYDGYGTLQLPAGTYSNVGRIKRVENTYNDLGITTIITTYMWMDNTYLSCKKQPIFIITSIDQSGITGSSITRFVGIRQILFCATDGIAELGQAIPFELYPNPSHQKLNFSFNLSSSSDVVLNIVDGTGRVALQNNFGHLTATSFNEEINVSELAKGIYLAILNVDGIISEKKFVVE